MRPCVCSALVRMRCGRELALSALDRGTVRPFGTRLVQLYVGVGMHESTIPRIGAPTGLGQKTSLQQIAEAVELFRPDSHSDGALDCQGP
eukprot:938958-Prymnesium_polylepis.1